MNNLLFILAIYVISLFGIILLFTNKKDKEEFLIAKRNRNFINISLSKFAGAIGVGWFIAYTAYAYEYGVGVFGLLLGTFLGYILFAFWASPKLYKNSKKMKFYTIGDFADSRLKSQSSKTLVNFMSSFILFVWTLTGIVGSSKIISEFGLLSYEVALLLISVIVLLYILIGGYKGVLITDILQSIVIILILFILTYSILNGLGNVSELFQIKTKTISITQTIGFIIFGVLSSFSYSNFYQLIYAGENSKSAKYGLALAVLPILFCAFLLLIIGLFLKSQNIYIDPGLAFAQAMQNFLPEYLFPFSLVLFMAGVMSSIDTNIYAITSHFVLNKKKSETSIRKIKLSSIVLIILVFCIAFFFRNIIKVTTFAALISVLISVGMIYLIAGGNNPKVFNASIYSSILGLIIGILLIGLIPDILIIVVCFSLTPLIFFKIKSFF